MRSRINGAYASSNVNLISTNMTRLPINNVYFITMVSVQYDGDLFKPFLNYYRRVLGLVPENFYVFLHLQSAEANMVERCDEMTDYAHSLGIRPLIFKGTFSSETKKARYMSLLDWLDEHKNGTRWVIHADADELHSFSEIVDSGCEHINLMKVINILELRNYTHIRSEWQDRISDTCSLARFDGRTIEDVFDKYPCTTDVARSYLKSQYTMKVILHNLQYRPKSGGYHELWSRRGLRPYPTIATTYHFKWRSTVVDKLTERLEIYRREGLSWWYQSKRALQKLKGNITCDCLAASSPSLCRI